MNQELSEWDIYHLGRYVRYAAERAARFNVEKIKPQDLAGAGGPPDEEG
jgi:hypothetical protein